MHCYENPQNQSIKRNKSTVHNKIEVPQYNIVENRRTVSKILEISLLKEY